MNFTNPAVGSGHSGGPSEELELALEGASVDELLLEEEGGAEVSDEGGTLDPELEELDELGGVEPELSEDGGLPELCEDALLPELLDDDDDELDAGSEPDEGSEPEEGSEPDEASELDELLELDSNNSRELKEDESAILTSIDYLDLAPSVCNRPRRGMSFASGAIFIMGSK